LENDSYKLYFDRTVLTDIHIQHNRPDIIILNKQQKQAYLAAQNGSVTAPGSQGVFQGKGVGSYKGARQLFGSLDTLSSCRDKRSSFSNVGKQIKKSNSVGIK
jgi:hypothetical protein